MSKRPISTILENHGEKESHFGMKHTWQKCEYIRGATGNFMYKIN
jgi:hypothetical protein